MARWSTVVLYTLVSLVTVVATGTANPAIPGTPAASPAPCPVTRPNGDMPPGSGNPEYTGGYGNDALWTNLWMWGKQGVVLSPDDDHVQPDGAFAGMKWAWYRYVPGTLEVEGRRLDAAGSPLEAWVPEGYGDIGFQVTGLTFPTTGCWEITGRVGAASLTFVILVELSTASASPATPP